MTLEIAGSRAHCDFDATRQNSGQIGNNIWYTVGLVDNGGRVTNRHTAYYLGDDGSQFNTAFLSTTPVRFIMEYDNVAETVTTISMIPH